MTEQDSFIDWFRLSAPYIRTHRGRTFVIVFGGEVLRSSGLADLVHDIALLHSLGVRIVLVAGSRPQIERRIQERGGESAYHNGIRITDAGALAAAREAAGSNRVELERLLSMGLPGSPMAGARVRVAAGNFVTARPLGVIDGVDFGFSGRVRRVDADAIRERLDNDAIVILTPLGYSVTGETFNLRTPELAAETAIALGADKIVCLVEGKGVVDSKGQIRSELTLAQARDLLLTKKRMAADVRRHLESAVRAVSHGVRRVHLVSRKEDGALLRELYTRSGIGTLVSSELFEGVRAASLRDVPSLLRILEPLEEQGLLVHRPREVLEEDIDRFLVIERDGLVVACAGLYAFGDEKMGELACLAVDPSYQTAGRGEALLGAIERRAQDESLERLFVLTTQGSHWFQERGFALAKPKDLPASRPRYNRHRRSKVLIKPLDA